MSGGSSTGGRLGGAAAGGVSSGGATPTGGKSAGGTAGSGPTGVGGTKAAMGGAGGNGPTGGRGLGGTATGGTAAGGAGGLGPAASGGRVTGYGTVLFSSRSTVQMIRLQTTLEVPLTPPASGTLFLWPGLQPNGANFLPIDNGVLQPVLTWGPSCAPGQQPRSYSTWWISGQYVNTFGKEAGYTGCKGGAIMSVAVGDLLAIDMVLAGTVWTQTITDSRTGQSVAYSIDMMNQAQNLAYFVIEEYSSAPVSTVVFDDTTITYDKADAADCKLTMRGQSDYVSAPVASSDGKTCTIAKMILRAQGIP